MGRAQLVGPVLGTLIPSPLDEIRQHDHDANVVLPDLRKSVKLLAFQNRIRFVFHMIHMKIEQSRIYSIALLSPGKNISLKKIRKAFYQP